MAYSTIPKSSSYFNTKLWTGTGATNAQTGLGFQPDLTWIKSRSNTYSHTWTDAIRGYTKHISSNTSNDEYSSSTEITSFDTDGFTLGTDAGVNNNGSTFVAWNWKANGSGSANSDGTISSTVSVDTTSGFSIVKYTGNAVIGATVGHGLGVAPKMIIVKNLSSGSTDWVVYHEALGNTKRIKLNTTAAEETNAFWNDTTPTSSVWSMNDNGDGNANGPDYIAYCFAEKTGFSKFGLYEANGNANGPFIYTGFKPAFVMIKAKGQTEQWYIMDNKRPGYNTNNYYLKANASDAEGTSATLAMSLLSNGFKINNNDSSMNTSGQGYVYMAFAEAPLVGSNNVPCTAR